MAAIPSERPVVTPYYDDGQIQIWLGDCREILPTLEPVDLVLTDPPYGVGYDLGNDSDKEGNRVNVDDALTACHSDTMLAFGSHLPYSPQLWDWRWTLIWHKPMARARPAWGIARHYERIHWYTKGANFLHPTSTMSDVITCNPPLFRADPETVAHPSQKPVALVRLLMERFGGDTILDPFMGSGTTLRAAKDLGRKAIGIEIEERYVEIAIKRLQQSVLPFEVPA